MADFTTLMVMATFCNVGIPGLDRKCEDGTPPKQIELRFLNGEPEPFDGASFSLPKIKTLQSLMEYAVDGQVVFVLYPDGSIKRRGPPERSDRIGRYFWRALANGFPAMCEAAKP